MQSRRAFLGATALQFGACIAAPLARGPADSPMPAWVAALAPWHWYEIPDTALSRVAPEPVPYGSTGPQAKVVAWNGAALKRAGSIYILGAAGGHDDYAGNEVDALALNTEAPGWVQLRAPTPNPLLLNGSGDGNGAPTQYNLDLRPTATHTYWGTQFIDALDRMMVFAAPTYTFAAGAPTPPGWGHKGGAGTYSFNLAKGDWDPPDFVAPFTDPAAYYGGLCAKHPVTGDVYRSLSGGRGMWRWTAARNEWTLLPGSQSRNPWYAGAAVDPIRARMLLVGGFSPMPPLLLGLDGLPHRATFGGLGVSALTATGYPGVVYDEVEDCFLVLANDGPATRLLKVDAGTLEVTRPATTGTTPAARRNGILNSVQYVPELKGIVFVNSYDGNALFLKTSA